MTISFKSAAAVIHEQPSSRSSTTAAFILGLSLALFAPMVLGNWNTVDLMSNRFYRLHWRLQGQQRLHFRVEAKSRGYFALGVSKTGTMNSADIVTGYIHPNGSAILLDRHSEGQKMPEIDASQDWQLISGTRNETHLNFEFSRLLVTGDSSNDVSIQSPGKNQIIYALGKVDPKDRSRVKYHGPKSRGVYELEL